MPVASLGSVLDPLEFIKAGKGEGAWNGDVGHQEYAQDKEAIQMSPSWSQHK